jgi:broad specificity phosphatase PhoE
MATRSKRPAGGSRDLFGSALADAAYQRARVLDSVRRGLQIEEIEHDMSVLSSALNRAQHLFRRSGRAVWEWLPDDSGRNPDNGLSGRDLADADFRVAQRLDPANRGIHYEKLKAAILERGEIKGPNPGKTILGSLSRADDLFDGLGHGIWRRR